MGPDQTTRSLLTPASSWPFRSTLAWGGELGACCVEHLLLFLASMDSVGLADEITVPLILCPRLEGFQASRRVLSSDRHLSAPPVMLCGALNIHRWHLPFLFLGHACTGASPGHQLVFWLLGSLHPRKVLSTSPGCCFFGPGRFPGSGRGQRDALGDDCQACEFSETLLRPTVLGSDAPGRLFSQERGPNLFEAQDRPHNQQARKWAHLTSRFSAEVCSSSDPKLCLF